MKSWLAGKFAWMAAKYATAAASNWLLVIGIALAATLVIYVQELRVFKAKCKSVQVQAQRYDNLADRLAIELEKDRDEIIKVLENGDNPCLDMSVVSLLDGED